MRQLMGQGEAVAPRSVLLHGRIDRDGLEVAGDEPIHFKGILEAWDRDDVHTASEFHDLFDGHRDSAGRVMGAKEIPRTAAEVPIGQNGRRQAVCHP